MLDAQGDPMVVQLLHVAIPTTKKEQNIREVWQEFKNNAEDALNERIDVVYVTFQGFCINRFDVAPNMKATYTKGVKNA